MFCWRPMLVSRVLHQPNHTEYPGVDRRIDRSEAEVLLD
jgi:hypothetical protein